MIPRKNKIHWGRALVEDLSVENIEDMGLFEFSCSTEVKRKVLFVAKNTVETLLKMRLKNISGGWLCVRVSCGRVER